MSHKIFVQDKQTVRIFPLGGIGNVTKNMYVYEYRLDGQLIDILLVDCGIGFPDETMYGVDLVIPDATNFVVETPVGIFYHGSDFKFDLTPPDNFPSELGKIAAAGEKGVLCLLSDSLGSERSGYTLSERIIEETIESEVRKCGGKLLFATQSSNISRIQQAVNVALQHNRKISFVGRSMDQNSEVARRLGYLSIPEVAIVHDKQILRFPDNLLFIIVAGSQGQTDSALARIGRGEHKYVKLRDSDTVILSADPIPGNENAVHELVDALTQGGARVSYSEVMEDLHVSGHGSQQDLRLMLSLTKPKYMLPIGGTYRHMIGYQKLAQEMGYNREHVLLPREGEIIEFSPVAKPRIVQTIDTEEVMIDGFG